MNLLFKFGVFTRLCRLSLEISGNGFHQPTIKNQIHSSSATFGDTESCVSKGSWGHPNRFLFNDGTRITNTISSCAQALYALRMLNSQGLNRASLQLLFSAIILAKLQYASPAWIGFASASDINKLDSFLARSKRSGFCSTNLPSFEIPSEKADSGLFRAITQNPGHVLHRLLPPKKPTTYNTRKRTHDFCIPQRQTNLNNRHFLERLLKLWRSHALHH